MSDSGRRGDHDRHDDRDYERGHRRRSRSRSRSPARSSRSRQDSDARRRRSPSRREPSETHREAVNATKTVPLEQFRTDYKTGKYTRLSYRDKMAMFGTTIMPIFVPLAPGETEAQYETRFRAWLHRLDRSFERLRADKDPYKEREHRIDFASDHVMGHERFEDFDWAAHTADNSAATHKATHTTHNGAATEKTAKYEATKASHTTTDQEHVKTQPDEEPEPANLDNQRDKHAMSARKTPARVCPCKQPSVKSGLTPAALTESHLSCGCTPCLFAVMDRLAQKVHDVEYIQAGAHGATSGVVDLTGE